MRQGYYLTILLTLLLLPLLGDVSVLRAQAVLVGQVCCFDGTEKRKPLAGVEVQALGAGSTVTDRNGYFRLNFRVLKQGDRIRFRRIYKVGYTVLNQEAVDAMVIPTEKDYLLTIVMTNDKQQEKARRAYYLAASKHFMTQQVRQERELKVQFKNGTLSSEEYHKKIQEVKRDFENRLDRAEEFVARFARVDISTLGAEERRILRLISKGKYNEAIELYDNQNLIGKFCEQAWHIEQERQSYQLLRHEITSHQVERDSMYNVLTRQEELLRLAGGKDNYAKALSLLRSAAYSDTTYARALLRYGKLCYNQLFYKEALDAYGMLRRHAGQDTVAMFEAMVMQGACMRMQYRFDEAQKVLNEAICMVDSNLNQPELEGKALYHLGHISLFERNYEQCVKYFEGSRKNFLRVLQQDSLSASSYLNLVQSFVFIGYCQSFDGNHPEALQAHKDAIATMRRIYMRKPRHYSAMMAYCYQHLGADYIRMEEDYTTEAMRFLSIADTLYQAAMAHNPEAYLRYLADLYRDMGKACMKGARYEEAAAYYKRSNQEYGRFLINRPDDQRAIRRIKSNNDSIVKVNQMLNPLQSTPDLDEQ